MSFVEINFDGLIGPTHNYGGLSLGNVASAANAGAVSRPRAAALQGLAKMRALMDLGLVQGFLPPHPRPDTTFLRSLGFSGSGAEMCAAAWKADPALLRNALSASSMWTANAATVSPSPDTADGRCHLSVANLATMTHRSIEAAETERMLRAIFGDTRYFAVHSPVPTAFGDEGAANFMRLGERHNHPALEIFVYGEAPSGPFPARQNRRASEAVARRHGLADDRTLLIRQSDLAIQAGAFHNDVVAVANEHVLFAHEHAFFDKDALYTRISDYLPTACIIEVAAADVSLDEAISSYLFNSQLISLPNGEMILVLPKETRDNARIWCWLEALVARGTTPITRLLAIDVRESMRNGGGPACLRLRVAMPQDWLSTLDQRFLLTDHRWERFVRLVEAEWPDEIAPDDIGTAAFWEQSEAAHVALTNFLQHF